MRDPAVREMMGALGLYVRTTRQLLGWSQEHLAEAARTSQGLISRMEAGRCTSMPFISVMKVLTALAANESPIGDAIPAPFNFVLACAAHLPGPRPAPPDAGLAELLAAYHGLSLIERDTFRRLVLPIAAVLDERGVGQFEPRVEVTTG